MNLVDGRDTIVDEVTTSSQDAQNFLADEFDALLSDPTFVEYMSWHLAPYEHQARKDIVIERMRRIAGI